MEKVNVIDSWDPTLKHYCQPDKARLKAIPVTCAPPVEARRSTARRTMIFSPLGTSGHVPGTVSDYAGAAGIRVWLELDQLTRPLIMGEAVTDPPTIPFKFVVVSCRSIELLLLCPG